MATFQPPPTWAEPVLVEINPRTGEGKSKFNPVWLKWFIDLVGVIDTSGGGGGTINHESLAGLLGGATSDHYHFTLVQHDALIPTGSPTFAGATVTGNLVVTATTFGLFGVTAVVQQPTIVDADGTLADITTKFNTLLAQLESLGLNANA